MAEYKRIIFSTETPNDQGGIIGNDVIDFNRYRANPVILYQHNWEEAPIGLMADIQLIGGKWTGIPTFHRLTEKSREVADMYEAGAIKASSIGGEAIWENTGRKIKNPNTGEYELESKLDENGNRTCKRFNLYEISIVTLPSNPDAVTLETFAAKIYEPSQLINIATNITKLSSNLNTMSAEEQAAADKLKADSAAAEKLASVIPAALPAEVKEGMKKQGLGAKILKAVGSFLGSIDDILDEAPPAKAPKIDSSELPKSEIKNPTVPQNTPIGLKAKDKAKELADEAKKKAAEKIAKAEEMKAAAEADDATEEMKSAYAAACDEMSACINEAKDLHKKYEAMDDEDEPVMAAEKETNAASPIKTINTAVAKPAIKIKTMAELQADGAKLKPIPAPRVVALASKDVKISKLMAEFNAGKDTDGAKIIARMHSENQEDKQISDYAVLGAAMLNDPKFKHVIEKVKFHVGKENPGMANYSPEGLSGGLHLQNIVAKLSSGYADFSTSYGHTERRNSLTKLNATDTFLGSPDLFAIEFLQLAIFALFPQTSWKNDIPIFGMQMSADNAGFVWANIAANPTIYKGSQPSNPAKYTYTDTAVAMQPVPYFLQPMLWTPWTMHQLRYDQMATGWAQAFAAMGAYIDDELIYTLASLVPSSSVVTSSGITPNPNGPSTPQTFTLNGTAANPNAFIWNPAFNGTLLNPSLVDIITTEQIYSKQYFDLSQQKATLVIDSTTEAFFAKDPYTLSLLTRWVQQNGGDFEGFKNTRLPVRSRVAIYDTATGLVKDPYGVIPSTCVSANLGFIPSQVGIGLAMLDVFMVQDPVNYGFVMSANTRVGTNALRANFNGLSLYTYGSPAPTPA